MAYDATKDIFETAKPLEITTTSGPHSCVKFFDPEQAHLESRRTYQHSECSVPSSSLRVGDLAFLEKDQRVPADMILLGRRCFVRTDELD